MSAPEKLPRAFYLRDTVAVARELLGKRLVHETEAGRLIAEITETEAYTGPGDRACHSYGGRRTARTEVMYLPGGHAYVYLIYGMYFMMNIVTGAGGDPCAVLLRGGAAVEGLDRIAQRRWGLPYKELTARQQKALLDGPGKLCNGLGLTKAQNGLDLLGETLYLTEGSGKPIRVGVGKRIGIDYAGEDANLPYRFFAEKAQSSSSRDKSDV